MKIKLLTGLCLLATGLFSTGLGATGEVSPEQTGPQIGQRAPAFTLSDQGGREVSLDALLKKGPVALIFIRSGGWCPTCQLRLIQLQRNRKEIEASGGQLVGISFDSTQTLKGFADRQTITFPLLSDTGSKTIEAFGMRNEVLNDGSANHGVVILDSKGVIRARLFLTSHDDRSVVEELVKALKEAQTVNGGTQQ